MTLTRYQASDAARGALLWRIGDPSLGASQFRGWVGGEAFVVGQSDPADFPGFHPTRGAQTTISFDADAAGAAFEVVVHVYAVGPSPQLEIDLNGVRGRWFLDPRREGHTLLQHPTSPIAGWAVVRAAFPADAVQRSANSLVLTTAELEVDEPTKPVEAPGFDGGIHFGSVEMVALGETPQPTIALVPLPFFKDGREAVDLVVTFPAPFADSHAEVEIGGFTERVALDLAPRHVGQQRVRLNVPEFDGPVAARVTLDVDGTTTEHDLPIAPCRKWTVHLLPHVHLDVGFTDYQAKVIELHNRNLERALDIGEHRDDYRFSIDGSFIVERYLASRSPEAAARVLDAIADGRMSLNAFYVLFLTGIASLEECYRAGNAAADLAEQFGVRTDYANLTDVPSYSWAIPSILRDMGIDRFMGISNHTRASNDDSDVLHLISPARWRGADGAEVLAYFSDGYSQLRWMLGNPPQLAGGVDALNRFLRRYDRADYLPTDIPVVGIHVDNEDLEAGEAAFVDAWNERFDWPRIRYSTISDYFRSVEHLYDELPLVTGDGGSFWEDGVGSGAAITAAYRRAQAALPAAEAATMLTTLVDDRMAADRVRFDAAWNALLIGCEHTWTAIHASSRPHAHSTADQLAWKEHQVATAGRLAVDLGREAMSRLGELATTSGNAVVVCNTLSWPRRVEVEIELGEHSALKTAGGRVLDGIEVDRVDGLPTVRVQTDIVPAFGYAVYEPVRVDEPRVTAWTDVGAVVETARWRLELDEATGRIRQLSHDGEPLLDAACAFALGEVVYATGGGPGTSLHSGDFNLFEPDIEVVSCDVRPTVMTTTRWGAVVRMRGEGPSLRDVQVEVTLHDAEDRVDLTVSFDKEAVLAKEGVYIAFPFAADQPTLRYDRQQGWVDPSRDHYPGACTEWFTTQHAVAVSDPRRTVVWTSQDAPLFTLGDVVRGRWATACAPQSGTLLSWVMNNYWFTNYPAFQDGPVSFSYSFTTLPKWDPSAAARFGRSIRTPLLVSNVIPLDKADRGPRRLPAAAESLLDVEADANVVVSLVSARRAAGALLRIQEVAGLTGRAVVPVGARRAFRCTATESDLEELVVDDGRVVVEVGPNAVVSVRFA